MRNLSAPEAVNKATINHNYMIGRKLTRSDNKMIAGVCGGLAEFFDFDVTLVRAIYALATVFTAFSGCIVYVILWLVMPRK